MGFMEQDWIPEDKEKEYHRKNEAERVLELKKVINEQILTSESEEEIWTNITNFLIHFLEIRKNELRKGISPLSEEAGAIILEKGGQLRKCSERALLFDLIDEIIDHIRELVDNNIFWVRKGNDSEL